MQRWHLTAGLTGLVILAAYVVPRLNSQEGPEVPKDTPPVIKDAPVAPPVVTTPVAAESGHLIVEAGLDRTALLDGQSNERWLTVTLEAPQDLGASFRRPVDLSVVMDVSGSMSSRGKIDYAKRAAKHLASSMESSDVYSLVTFSDDASTVIPATSIRDVAVIHHAIDRIYEGGGTNLYSGMVKGSDEVKRGLNGENAGRIVILSDGMANVGITDPDSLTRFAAQMAGQGIAVSAIGLGLDYNEDLLARIADVGGGTYDFVDDPRQLESVFADELERSTSVVARSTKVELTLPPGVKGLEIIGWDAERTANGWIVDVGEIYAGDARKIVARVVVEATGTEMAVAGVTATYHDAVDDAPGLAIRAVSADVTRDAHIVEKSVDKEVAVEAARAYGNWYLDQSSRAYADGKIAEAQQLAGEGQAVLSSGAADYGDADLEAEADNLAVQQQNYGLYRPESDEGRRVVKKNKAVAREAAR